MLIADSKHKFLSFIADRGKLLEKLHPRDLVLLGCSFYEEVRAEDARPDHDDGDALLFQWGTQEEIPGYCDACFYIDLTRQFISHESCDDEEIFQLSCQLQYPPSDAYLAIGNGNRWCTQLTELAELKQFMLLHPALATVGNTPARTVQLSFGGI
jgi:hypothetical protein